MKETDINIVGNTISGISGGALDRKEFPLKRQMELCKKANREFYFRPSYIARKLTKIRSFNDVAKYAKAAMEII